MRTLITVLCLFAALGWAAEAYSGSPRRCVSATGKHLYSVEGSGRVTDASGKMLGRVENGNVYNASGTLVARDGDAGLLYR